MFIPYQPSKNVITSKDDLFTVIQSVYDYRLWAQMNYGVVYEMYRGQGRASWKLQPNIARSAVSAEEVMRLEKNITKDFYARIIEEGLSKSIQTGFFNKKFHSEWLLIQQAQHFRIPTRFMDWTNDWEVALFFAVENPADDNYDGQFWIYIIPPGGLTIDNNDPSYLDVNPYTFDRTIFLNSAGLLAECYLDKLAERRKNRQRGKFCIQSCHDVLMPLEEQEQHIPNLSKIIIPKEIKKKLREELAEDNITDESLYIEQNTQVNQIVEQLKTKYNL